MLRKVKKARASRAIESRIAHSAIRYVQAWIAGDRAWMSDAIAELYQEVKKHPEWRLNPYE